jgi:hypothetical protein
MPNPELNPKELFNRPSTAEEESEQTLVNSYDELLTGLSDCLSAAQNRGTNPSEDPEFQDYYRNLYNVAEVTLPLIIRRQFENLEVKYDKKSDKVTILVFGAPIPVKLNVYLLSRQNPQIRELFPRESKSVGNQLDMGYPSDTDFVDIV